MYKYKRYISTKLKRVNNMDKINYTNSAQSDVSDRELLKRICDKDEAAFNRLFYRYDSIFRGWIFKHLNNTDDVEELMQKYWIEIWRKASSIEMKEEESDSAKPLLMKKLSQRLLDQLRKTNKESERVVSLDDDENVNEELDIANAYSHVIEDFETAEMHAILYRAVDELPGVAKKIFKMRWENDWSFRKIAKNMDMKVETVKKKYKKAKDIIEEKIQETYNEPNGKKKIRLAALALTLFNFFS